MPIETPGTTVEDQSAVAAVRGGDPERYRELVERHQRRVYAVAWSRLGDATLAEEATQEAFIRAYQRLRLLADGSKFAGWVSAIARRVAVNFSLSHRRELDRRRRWAMETAVLAEPETLAAGQSSPHSPEILRQTLAELPHSHRECLVLFYIEGKSGAEAAALLGVSETALRARLRRARAAMRERLEEKLEISLAGLRPPESLAPAVMGSLFATSSAKAATGALGAKIIAACGKKLFLTTLAPLFSLLASLPSLVLGGILGRMERANYKESQGFRPRLHLNAWQSFVWGFPLLFTLLVFLNRSALAAWGVEGSHLLLLVVLFGAAAVSARQAVFFRHKRSIGSFGYCAILCVGTLLLDLGLLSPALAALPLLAATVWFYFTLLEARSAGLRMDHNLFLRESQGMLKTAESQAAAAISPLLDRQALRQFARFLGTRLLATNFRWDARGLALSLPPVRRSFLAGMASVFLPPVGAGTSRIHLDWDGKVAARCADRDVSALASLTAGAPSHELPEIETAVANAAARAWAEFRAGNLPLAEKMLGESPESQLFLIPPARARSARGWRALMAAAGLLLLFSVVVRSWGPVWMSGLKPVEMTEAQAARFLHGTNSLANPSQFNANSPAAALFTCLALPSAGLFNADELRTVRDEVAGPGGFDGLKPGGGRNGLQRVFAAPLPRLALAKGWVRWEDLGVTPGAVAEFLRASRPPFYSRETWDHFLTRLDAWSWVSSERFPVLRIQNSGVMDLRLLGDLGCLDLVDREKLASQIASVQTLSATPPGQPPIHDWKVVRGLFFTPGWPALQDTHSALAALEILGALDKVDREASAEGILRLHHGGGYFTSPETGGFNEYHVDGSARDTIAAFESLRILGALDRVKDLEQWKFRPLRRGVAPGAFTWQDIEAWVCNRRLEKMLADRRSNPQAPFRSLLDPD